jgi:hypothetical protein
MGLRETVFSNRMLRLILRGGDVVTNYPSNRKGDFAAYFHYVIGKYQDDFYLYFPEEPTTPQYYNEIFNKMVCYYGNDAVQFVRFHYELYPDKRAFLDFLFYELKHRNNKALGQTSIFNRSSARRMSSIFECVSDWVAKQVAEQKAERKQNIYATLIRNDLRVIVNNNLAEQGQANFSKDELAKIVETLYSQVDGIVEKMEEKTSALLNKMSEDYVTGNIVGSHPQSIGLFIITLLALKDFRIGNALLLEHFTETDIGKILKLHFEYFKTNPKEHATITKKYISPVKELYYSDSFDETREQIDALLGKIFKVV